MKKRFVVLTAALAVTLACASCSAGNAGWNPEAVSNTPLPHTDDAYARYLAQYSSAPQGLGEIFIDTQNQQQGEWRFSVPNAGLYHLEITYRAVEGRVNDIETFLLIDGEAPYKNAEMFVLPRLWADETQTVNGRFPLDAAGNETRPRQAELFEAQTSFVTDSLGKYSGPLSFYLSEGSHTVSLAPRLERAEFISLCFRRSESPVPYSEYYQPSMSDSSGQMLVLEAELAGLKSSNTLFPTYDKSRASISPSHPALTRYNTIGRDTWNKPGQTLTYYAEVPQDGYYHLAFKVKQNMKRGMYSTRAVYVDGEIPFAELGGVRFPNQPAWYVTGAADDAGAPYKIFLTKGRHAISIEAVLGAEEEPLREADSLVAEMNEWYRKIIVITGSNADSSRVTLDLNRDFLLDLKIPGLIDAFAAISARLDKCAADINALYGEGSGGNAGTVMAELAQQLRVFVDDPDKIPARLENYYGGISSMATWVLEMRSQPLEMDWFALYSPDVSAPEAGGNFFSQLLYRTQMFFSSFSGGYNALGVTADKAQKPLEVWVSLSDISSGSTASGRDQANVIKRLIDGMFTPATGIKVNLSLISGSNVLMQAIVAGRGPDAAMVVSRDVPVNLAMRGALVPLDNFEGFESAADNFMPGALTPYQYEGGTYALPETQSFDMLFYRTDVFEELGLTPPKTWAEFYYVLSVLQRNNLLTGIPESQRMFEALLYQKGASLYSANLSSTAFDEPEALAAFEQWTGLYAKYSLPLVFDFFNRFRSGEMPMAIVPYTQCNYLAGAAPEIKGLWDFAPVPGTVYADGTVSNAETATGTGCVMVAKDDTIQYQNVFDFLSWWVSADAQAQFGLELENLMGAAARYPTANVEAFERLPWEPRQTDALTEQWKQVVEAPQIPGGYYVGRNISFAFRSVIYGNANERETLYKYNKEINKEITRKRIEFDLY